MKKIKINGEFALLIALIFLSAGIILVIKADFGMTVVQAPVFILSEAIPAISMGTWNYIMQGFLFVIMLIVIKHFKYTYIFSFITGIVYGLILDLFIYLMQDIIAGSFIIAIIFYILGFFSICIAVALFFTCKAPLMPYDIFIREISEAKKLNLTKFKWIYDLSFIVFSFILSFLLTGKIIGIGAGTIIFAFLVSPVMTLIIRFINKFVIFESIFNRSSKA